MQQRTLMKTKGIIVYCKLYEQSTQCIFLNQYAPKTGKKVKAFIPSLGQIIKNVVRKRQRHKHRSAKLNQSLIITDSRKSHRIIRSSTEFNQQINPIPHHCQTRNGQYEVQKLQQTFPATPTSHPPLLTMSLESFNQNQNSFQCTISFLCTKDMK